MTMPDWLTPSQLEAAGRGMAQALADCARIATPTVADVTLDRGGFAERTHIGWCLACQLPTARCGCDHADAAEVLVEDQADVEDDTITALLARTRAQLDIYAASVPPIADVAIAGDRL